MGETVQEGRGKRRCKLEDPALLPSTPDGGPLGLVDSIEEDDTQTVDSSSDAISTFVSPLVLENDTIYGLARRFSEVFKELAAGSLKQFFPTAVTRLPTGQETGHYLAAYVGLSYLKVAFIDLLGAKETPVPLGGDTLVGTPRVRRTLEKAWSIEDRLKKDNAKDLFAWIGDCVAEVVADSLDSGQGDCPASIEMGISFCFPIKQGSLHEAVLMPTGKGFAINSNLNLREALLDGYDRHIRRANREFDATTKRLRSSSLPTLKIVAITNDTVATLASLAYSVPSIPNSKVVMGLIVGSGCNATILMDMKDLHEEKTEQVRLNQPEATEVLVSTEWTLADSAAPLKEFGIATEWDEMLEAASSRPGFQPLEYMVGGRYIGELVRIMTYDYFVNFLRIPREAVPLNLKEPYRLRTEFLSHVVASPSATNQTLAAELCVKLPSQGPSSEWDWTPETAQALRTIASNVQLRSAALIAAATAGLLACTGHIRLAELPSPEPDSDRPAQEASSVLRPSEQRSPEELVVAFSGGVIQLYPWYKVMVQKFLDRILLAGEPQDGGKSVLLREASDGGIIGVGVLAGTTGGKIETITGAGLEAVRDTKDPQS